MPNDFVTGLLNSGIVNSGKVLCPGITIGDDTGVNTISGGGGTGGTSADNSGYLLLTGGTISGALSVNGDLTTKNIDAGLSTITAKNITISDSFAITNGVSTKYLMGNGSVKEPETLALDSNFYNYTCNSMTGVQLESATGDPIYVPKSVFYSKTDSINTYIYISSYCNNVDLSGFLGDLVGFNIMIKSGSSYRTFYVNEILQKLGVTNAGTIYKSYYKATCDKDTTAIATGPYSVAFVPAMDKINQLENAIGTSVLVEKIITTDSQITSNNMYCGYIYLDMRTTVATSTYTSREFGCTFIVSTMVPFTLSLLKTYQNLPQYINVKNSVNTSIIDTWTKSVTGNTWYNNSMMVRGIKNGFNVINGILPDEGYLYVTSANPIVKKGFVAYNHPTNYGAGNWVCLRIKWDIPFVDSDYYFTGITTNGSSIRICDYINSKSTTDNYAKTANHITIDFNSGTVWNGLSFLAIG